MKKNNQFTKLALIFSIFLAVLLIVPKSSTAQSNSPEEILTQSWTLAQSSNTYGYRSEIDQLTYPEPSLRNAGKEPSESNLAVEGSIDQQADLLEMSFWRDGSFNPDTAVSLRVEQGEAYGRLGDSEWEKVDNVSSLFAPGGDPLGFLAGVSNIEEGEIREIGLGGVDQVRQYTFELDGPAFAQHIRLQLEQQLRDTGSLPVGFELGTPEIYANMSGEGELWIDQDGLPYRLHIGLTLPPEEGNGRTVAFITTDYYNFDKSHIASATATLYGDPQAWFSYRFEDAQTRSTIALQVLILAGALGLAVLIVKKWHSRKFYVVQALILVFAQLFSPMLRGYDVHAFYNEQLEIHEAENGRTAEADFYEDAQDALQNRWNPHANPLETQTSALAPTNPQSLINNNQASFTNPPALLPASSITANDSDGDGLSDEDEDDWLTCPSASSSSEYCDGVADPTDTDGDGLSDGVEVNDLGIIPTIVDSDGDGISDYLEVTGFSYNGQMWYLDPFEQDTNGDNVLDNLECDVWYDVSENFDDSAICPDTDNDGTPDVFDTDNDGDGIDDVVDLSPNLVSTETYDEDNPFSLTVNNLQTDKPVFVDFQFRPVDEEHLTYYTRVLDWPANDYDGQIQRVQDTTFATTTNPDIQSDDIYADNGDIRFVPMLEITIPYSDGHYGNLPINSTYSGQDRTIGVEADEWIDETELDPYGIVVRDVDETSGDLTVLVPITLVTGESGGGLQGFASRMLYYPEQGTAGTVDWGNAHEIRMLWLVQMITDECVNEDDDPEDCTRTDTLDVIQIYDEEWFLTGLSVTEEHGIDVALVYEDPAQDTDFTLDEELWMVSWNMTNTFLRGRDCDSMTNDTCNSDGNRDVTITTLESEIDEWSSNDNYIMVDTFSYLHEGYLAHIAMTETIDILDNVFTPYADQTNPTILIAQEKTSRNQNVENIVTSLSDSVTFDLDPAENEAMIMANMSWVPYQYVDGAWDNYDVEDYLTLLEFYLSENDEFVADVIGDEEEYGGKLIWAQLYYAALYAGFTGIVEYGDVIAWVEADDTEALSELDYEAGWSIGVQSPLEAMANNSELVLSSLFDIVKKTYKTEGKWKKFYRAFNFDSFDLTNGRQLKLVQSFSQYAVKFVVAIAALSVLVIAYGLITGDGLAVEVGTYILTGAIFLITVTRLSMLVVQMKTVATTGSKLLYTLDDLMGVAKKARSLSVIGNLISFSAIWGVFIYQLESGALEKGTNAYNEALALAIAATIVLIIFIAIEFIPIVGPLIVMLIAVIDLILYWFGVTGFSEWLTETIASWLYDTDMLIANLSDSDRLEYNIKSIDLVNLEDGFTYSNSVDFTLTVTNTLKYHSGFNSSQADRATFRYFLQGSEIDRDDELSANEMQAEWNAIGNRQIQTVVEVTTDSPVNLSSAGTGINQSFDGLLYLSEAYVEPYEGCWLAFGFEADCDWYYNYGTSHINLGQYQVYDVLPDTIGEFVALDWNNGGAVAFPSQTDYDADGLLSKADGGADPDDTKYDTDGDGLSDYYEISNGLDAEDVDTDGDNLSDKDEILLGTDPLDPDTDNDGLSDYTEMVEGWLIVYDGNKTTRVWSNPYSADADDDTLSDLEEFVFGFHPWVETDPSQIENIIQFDRFEINEIDTPEILLKFEESAGATVFVDSSGEGNTAVCNNSTGSCPTAEEDGKFGDGLLFDGGDQITLSNVDLAGQSFTVAAWVKRDANGEDTFFQQSTGGNQFQFGFGSDNKVFCSFSGTEQIVTTGTYAESDWHHWACTFESTTETLTIYRDGVQLLQDTGVTPSFSNDTLLIGQDGFNGNLDEVIVYYDALTVDEVNARMNGRYNPNDLIVLPGDTLSYQATVTNTHALQGANGLLVAQSEYYSPTIPTPDVVLHFEEDEYIHSFINSTGEEHAATCPADDTCPQAGQDGVYGTGIAFDGTDDFLTFPSMGDSFEDLTFAFWLNVTSLPAAGERAYILDTESTETGALDIYINDAGNLVFDVAGQDYGPHVTSYSFSGNLNSWRHAGLIYSGADTGLYWNGTGNVDTLQHFDDNTTPVIVGPGRLGNSIDGSSPYHGKMDDSVIYSEQSLGSPSAQNSEITSVYEGNYTVRYTGYGRIIPTFLLKFDEVGTGYVADTFLDSSSESNHAYCLSTDHCPELGTDSVDGYAIAFDGVDDRVYMYGAVDKSENYNEPTIYMDVKLNSLPAAGEFMYLFDTVSGSNQVEMYVDSDGYIWVVWDDEVRDSNSQLVAGTWYSIRLFYDRGNNTYSGKLFINGGLDETFSLCSSSSGCRYNTSIGPGWIGSNAANTAPLDGTIDNFYLQSRNAFNTFYTSFITFDLDNSVSVGLINDVNQGTVGRCDNYFTCPQITSSGKFDDGLLFDGVDDYLTVDTQETLVGDYTIGFWFKTSASGEVQLLFAATDSDNSDYGGLLFATQAGGNLEFTHRLPAAASGGTTLVSPAAVNDGAWHYATAVRADNTLTFYIDGVEAGSATDSNDVTTTLDVTLGRFGQGETNYFDGTIDEMILLDTAVSADAIPTLMNGVWPAVAIDNEFQIFNIPSGTSVDVSGTAVVDENAQNGIQRFEQEVEVALELQQDIDFPVIDIDSTTLALYVPFDDVPGSTIFEDAAGDTDFTCTTGSCPVAGLRGFVDRAAYFDGVDDYLPANGDNSQTFAVWVKADVGTIFDTRADTTRDGIMLDTNRLLVAIDRNSSSSYEAYDLNFEIPDNVWTHLAVVAHKEDDLSADYGNVMLYINGQLAGTISTDYPNDNDYDMDSGGPTLGANADSSDPLLGYIDDLRGYEEAFTDAQILELYETSAALLRFEFDEEEDATLFLDSSLNGFVGTPYSTTYYDSTIQQNVTVYNPVPGTDGKIGNTALFDTDGFIEVDGAADAIDFTQDFTIMTWLKTAETEVGILAKTDDDSSWETGEKIFYLDSNGYPTFVGFGNNSINSATAVNDDVWNHVVVTWDASAGTGKIYVDGVDVTSSSTYAANNADNVNDTIKIGAPNYNEAPNFLSGELDELVVYGRSLAAEEIFSVYLRELRWYRDRGTAFITIDTDDPTITYLTDYAYRSNGYIQLAVSAADDTSVVTMLEMGLKAPSDSGYSWSTVPVCEDSGTQGAAWCPYFDSSFLDGEGVYEVQFRAVDAVGHEATVGPYDIYVDDTAPTVNASYSDTWFDRLDNVGETLAWTATINGTISDPNVDTGIAGSGVATDTMTLRLIDSTGNILNGVGQIVTITGGNWSIDYQIDGQIPVGTYTIEITAEDVLGNSVTQTMGTIRMDERPSTIDVHEAVLPDLIITRTTTISGVVSELPNWGGALAEYHFEEVDGSAQFVDFSQNGNDATCSSCPSVVSSGAFGTAVQFDGTSSLDVPYLLDPASERFSVSLWVNVSDLSTQRTLVSQDGGEDWLYINTDGTIGSDLGTGLTSVQTVSTGNWVHLALSYNGEMLHLYVDGAPDTAVDLTPTSSSGMMAIGTGSGGANSLVGLIDELTIYEGALSRAEAYALAQTDFAGVDTVEVGLEIVDFDAVNTAARPTLVASTATIAQMNTPSWNPATVDQSGNNLSKWSYQLPNGLEDFYQIHVRSTDGFDNDSNNNIVWRGSVDTLDPRVNFSAQHLGGGSAAQTEYSFSIDDLFLDVDTLDTPCDPSTLEFTYHDNPARIDGVNATCRVDGHVLGTVEVTACDYSDQCVTKTENLTASAQSASVSISTPLHNSTFTLTQPISVTGAAFAPNGIEDVVLSIDGAFVDLFSYGGAQTDVNWETNWLPAEGGTYEITAVMTDSLNAVYSSTATVNLLGSFIWANLDGNGSGLVSSTPVGIECGITCTTIIETGTAMTLTAVPDTGTSFDGWSGDCSGTGDCTFTLDSSKTVTASFNLIPYDVTILPTGDGSGTVTSEPTGISCGADCTETWDYGTVVTVTAVPDAGSVFNGWSGDECSGQFTCVFTLSADTNINAEFLDASNVGVTITPTVTAVTEGGATDVYTVSLNTNPTSPVTVTLSTDAHLTLLSQLILSNTNPVTVTVTAVDDALVEGTHSSIITHTTTSADPYYDGAAVADVTAIITDNDVQYELDTLDTAVPELDLGQVTTVTYTITRTGNISGTSQVDFDLNGGTAVLNDDFALVSVTGSNVVEDSGTITFTAGAETAVITTQVVGDDVDEDDEEIGVSLLNSSGTNGSGSSFIIGSPISTTIQDDDTRGFAFSDEVGLTVTEGGATDDFSIALTSQPTANVQLGITPSNDQIDFGAGIGQPITLTFTTINWWMSQTVTITAVDDDSVEPTQMVTLTHNVVGGDYGTLTPANIDVTVLDNDTAGVRFTPASLTITETGTISNTAVMTLDSLPTDPVTITLSTDDTTECLVSPSEIVFQPADWNSGHTVTVTSVDENIDDADQLCTVLTAPASSDDADYDGLDGTDLPVAVIDDDGEPSLNWSQTAVSIDEDAGTLSLTLSLSNPSAFVVQVDVDTTDQAALAGLDYTAVAETLQIQPLEMSYTVTIPILEDTLDEVGETFSVTLSSPVNGQIGLSDTVVVTILDNDDPPTLEIADSSTPETDGLTSMTFTVTLSTASSLPITVDYTTVDDTAVAGLHYTAVTGTLTFNPGETSQTITVPIIGDDEDNFYRYFEVHLSNPTNASISNNEAIGTILDDEIAYIYFPLAVVEYPKGPDLVVEEVVVTETTVEVTVMNIGDAPVEDEFWVDLYLDPAVPPTAVNQTIQTLDSMGAVWGVTEAALPLNPGESLTLTMTDEYYRALKSRLPAVIDLETAVYVQVDSAGSSYGGVNESHEKYSEPYNNIYSSE